MAKDVFLTIAGKHGAHVNQNVEYGGSGLTSLLNARRTLAIMGTELSAEFVIFEPDAAMLDYVRARARRRSSRHIPMSMRATRSGATWRSTRSSHSWRCRIR